MQQNRSFAGRLNGEAAAQDDSEGWAFPLFVYWSIRQTRRCIAFDHTYTPNAMRLQMLSHKPSNVCQSVADRLTRQQGLSITCVSNLFWKNTILYEWISNLFWVYPRFFPCCACRLYSFFKTVIETGKSVFYPCVRSDPIRNEELIMLSW